MLREISSERLVIKMLTVLPESSTQQAVCSVVLPPSENPELRFQAS